MLDQKRTMELDAKLSDADRASIGGGSIGGLSASGEDGEGVINGYYTRVRFLRFVLFSFYFF